MTPGTPLVRLCPEGCPPRQARKTNPEGGAVVGEGAPARWRLKEAAN